MVIDGLFSKIDYSSMVKINNDARKQIIKIASTNPRDLGLKSSKHYYPRIVLVFLPTSSPYLNLIEIRWL